MTPSRYVQAAQRQISAISFNAGLVDFNDVIPAPMQDDECTVVTSKYFITIDAALAASIKNLAMKGDLLQHEIAARLNINQGRVSEVLTGKRFPNVQPD